MAMFKWRQRTSKGQRLSDQPAQAPTGPRRDRALEQAIDQDAIQVRFQPLITPRDGLIVGAEALARWSGAASNDVLFERAAEAGLAERLSRFIQRKALGIAAAWRGPLAGLSISINLLPEELARGDYDQWLLAEMAAVGMDPRRVTVEITEGGLIFDSNAAAARLDGLRAAGVRVAIDDFGAGYASLAWLTSLPLDVLKIDRSLVADMVGGERDRIVVKAMIELAHELGMQVVVEGVESTDQLALLSDWGCDYYQGFLGAGALDEVELARFVAATLTEAA
jgi:EAL domain-containing protein (putative c-di-GMP-specific phosphodiesterase class I)